MAQTVQAQGRTNLTQCPGATQRNLPRRLWFLTWVAPS